ncbi:MAG: transketolase family protein, partial [Endomicrobia bacterium]|nr:transketolase family protein [Endomicrobiia bacterium]
MKVIVPCDVNEAKNAVIASLEDNGPVYIRLSREKLPVISKPEEEFKLGKAKLLTQGSDCAIIACGVMVYEALIAAEELNKEGIKSTIVNLHTIKPIDEETIIKVAKQCGCVVTCEEHQISGGMGSAVAEVLSKNYPVIQEFVGIKDKFGESGKAKELMTKYELTSQSIIQKVKHVIQNK